MFGLSCIAWSKFSEVSTRTPFSCGMLSALTKVKARSTNSPNMFLETWIRAGGCCRNRTESTARLVVIVLLSSQLVLADQAGPSKRRSCTKQPHWPRRPSLIDFVRGRSVERERKICFFRFGLLIVDMQKPFERIPAIVSSAKSCSRHVG